MRIHTNAKVNLLLSVRNRRPDGYHEVETVLQSVGVADDLDIRPTPGPLRVRMRATEGGGGPIPGDRDNLVYRAAEALGRRGARAGGASIDIVKRIPIGGGLGGGSANAAGALRALNELWSAGLSETELLDVGADVGSDVPACVLGGTVLARGRGESVRRLTAPTAMWFVLGISDEPLSTGDVYGRWKPREEETSDGETLIGALSEGDVHRVATLMRNDLEPATLAFRPDLRARKETLIDAGALGALVSGSGPTVFGVARDEVHAREIAGRAAGSFDRVEVVSSRRRCVEPGEPGGDGTLD